MELSKVVAFLRKFAPIEIAEAWDNVGLLLEPSMCAVKKVLLTNDLTESVMDEAIATKANLIVSYHPPLFTPIKRICQDNWKSRIVIRCLENRIAIYSPHTSWDNVRGGVNDWLSKAFRRFPHQVDVLQKLTDSPDVPPGSGIGRQLTLEKPIPSEEALEAIKSHVGAKHIRLARPTKTVAIQRVGICAGSGSSVIRLAPAGTFDMVLTGEMSHHDVLDLVHQGSHVVLCEHSNSERGFLHEFKTVLEENLQLAVEVSTADKDPLSIE